MCRTALITGSTSGIGLGIAHALAKRGYNILLSGFGDDQLVRRLETDFNRKYKVKTKHIAADLANRPGVDKLVREAKKTTNNKVDILVNNAGFQHVRPIEEFDVSVWDTMLAVMLTAPFLLCQGLLPDMKRNGFGRIVNISSAHGIVASANKSAYVTAKHGIIGLTKVLALETAGSGVTCNSICPGYVDTPILQSQVQPLADTDDITLDEARQKFLGNFHATGQPVPIKDLAELVCFLCSESANQMTGSSLVIDGGWTAK